MRASKSVIRLGGLAVGFVAKSAFLVGVASGALAVAITSRALVEKLYSFGMSS